MKSQIFQHFMAGPPWIWLTFGSFGAVKYATQGKIQNLIVIRYVLFKIGHLKVWVPCPLLQFLEHQCSVRLTLRSANISVETGNNLNFTRQTQFWLQISYLWSEYDGTYRQELNESQISNISKLFSAGPFWAEFCRKCGQARVVKFLWNHVHMQIASNILVDNSLSLPFYLLKIL